MVGRSPNESNPDESGDEIQAARESAIRMLARRSYGAVELGKRMEGKGISPDVVRDVIGWLTERGWINDADYAAALVESRQRALRGRFMIRQELLQKGIDRAIVDESIARGIDEEQEIAAALRVARAAANQYLDGAMLSPLDRRKAWAKVAGRLLRRGFSAEVVTRVLRLLGEGDLDADGTLLDTPGT